MNDFQKQAKDDVLKRQADAILEAHARLKPSGMLLALSIATILLYVLFRYSSVEVRLDLLIAMIVTGAPLIILIGKRKRCAAQLPCPRCHKPFGYNPDLPSAKNTLECQHCGLKLNQDIN